MANRSRYHIVIDCNGDKTTAFMFVGGKCVKVTQAKRNPEDKFSLRVGAETAFNRLFEKKEKEEKPKSFKVGDRVVYTDNSTNPSLCNAHGTVRIVSNEMIGVEFDNRVFCGHSLNPYTCTVKRGHGWWCLPQMLKHEQEAKR